ncbi:unnamed protein product, partial [Didymodactylos carnosus]
LLVASPTTFSSFVLQRQQHIENNVSTTITKDYNLLSDQELIQLIQSKELLLQNLEKYISYNRSISIRRTLLNKKLSILRHLSTIDNLPYENYDYSRVINRCCENVIGYVQIPVGYVGPLIIDEKEYYIPLATTEGALVASTNRGCKVIRLSGGIRTTLFKDGMTRGPVLKFQTGEQAYHAFNWLDDNFDLLKTTFDKTSSYAKLISIKKNICGKLLFIRFVATTGDAMGMNMISKGVSEVLSLLQSTRWGSTIEIMSLSGNYCTDKKATALNFIDGRGKSVMCEATIPCEILENQLKLNAQRLTELNLSKNLLGSIMASSVGGYNAHAANIVAAIFIACGQDPAQVISSSNCITWLEPVGLHKQDLYISCTMHSLEVGTIGGGTRLPGQEACLKMLGVSGSNIQHPGDNSKQLAKIICATVLSAELSLLSALATNELISSHLRLNRKSTSDTN